MPLLSRIGNKSWGMLSVAVIRIRDAFARTASSLGVTDTGQTWEAIRGTWSTNGSQAISNDAANTYPLAVVDAGTPDSSSSVEVSQGTGLAFWVTDSGSWWASSASASQSSSSYSCNPYSCNPYSCNCSSYSYSCNPYDCNPVDCNPYQCNPQTTYSCPSGGSLSGTTCNVPGSSNYVGFSGTMRTNCTDSGGSWSGGYCNYPGYSYGASSSTTYSTCYQTCYSTCYQTCSGTTCDTCYSTCYQTCTSTTTSYFLQLLKSVSGTVSEATSAISLGSAAVAIAVQTLGDSVTATAFSNSAKTASLGSINITPSSPAKSSKVGVIKVPTSYSQGSTIDNFASN